jgi:HlyD family secretion protein
MKHWIRNLLVLVIALALLGAMGAWWKNRGDKDVSPFRTAAITRSDIVATITATGTVEPTESIDIGAQVQGRIIAFGKDKTDKDVDNNSEVEEGMVLAMIDPSVYQSQVDQATAQSNNANAAVQRANADLLQFQANLHKAQLDWDRAEKLGPSDALSQADYDMYKAAFEAAKANVEVGRAAIEQAKAQVSQAAAQLKLAKQNLGYCTITSPVKGVVITRRVNIGQTVVSSLSAPSLFLIAKDLTKLQIWTAVNEADIGQIHAGQNVTFNCDAFGGRKFHGVVSKVRMDAQMTQNVVTYTVEITVDNGDRTLVPYLTANVNFEVNRHNDVLAVPNAALRYVPQMEQISPSARDQAQAMMAETSAGSPAEAGGSGTRRRDRSTTRPATQSLASSRPYRERDRSSNAPQSRKAVVWIQDGQFVKPLPVTAGLTDGKLTEISGQDVTENTQIVIGDQISTGAGGGGTSAGGSNPFIPQFRRTGSGGGGGGGGGRGR